jgi:hypothetical protein
VRIRCMPRIFGQKHERIAEAAAEHGVQVVDEHLAREHAMLSVLSATEREQLVRITRTLLAHLEAGQSVFGPEFGALQRGFPNCGGAGRRP